MKPIYCSYEKAGNLHADNPNHPGITEEDIIEVLSNMALVKNDASRRTKKCATGTCSGAYDVLTVVYIETAASLRAITAYPSSPKDRKLYMQLMSKGGGELWIPAQDTK